MLDVLGIARGARWGDLEELVASLIEVVDQGNRQFVMAHRKRGAHAPRPVKVLRPFARRKKKPRPMTDPVVRRFFGKTAEVTFTRPEPPAP